MKSYKGVTFKGSTFPDDPYRHIKVVIDQPIIDLYIPAMDKSLPKGLRLLMIAMTDMEGFRAGSADGKIKPSRSFRTNNPGNVGNMDNGQNKTFPTLAEGIAAQAKQLQDIAAGLKKYYPIGKLVVLKPGWSAEVDKNKKLYGRPDGYYPGYSFTYTGQLDQFIKIYSTGARFTNVYINQIVSYFADNGIVITPESTLAEIIAIQ